MLIAPAVAVSAPGLIGAVLLIPGVIEIPFVIHALFGIMVLLAVGVFVWGVWASISRLRLGLQRRFWDFDAGVFLVGFLIAPLLIAAAVSQRSSGSDVQPSASPEPPPRVSSSEAHE